MTTIGTFAKVGAEYHGEIYTLELDASSVRIVPTNASGENAPSHLIYLGRVTLGAAWPRNPLGGRPYLFVKLDDPSLKAPISGNLTADDREEVYSLIWSRPRKTTA